MKSLLVPVVLSLMLGGCGGCKGDDDAAQPDGGEPDAGVPGDPTTGAWRAGFSLPGPNGFGSRVEAVAIAPGGDVYAAGIFTDAAGTTVANVARWTGTEWTALGAGIDGWVRALAVDSIGYLWAAVTASDATVGTVQRWDGTTWTVMGVADGAITDLVAITDLAAPQDQVVVVGEFTTMAFIPTASVAAYDDVLGWHQVGDGTINGVATAVAADTVGYCVAGSFDTIGGVAADNVACTTGGAWTPLGSGLPGGVATLVKSPGGTWYAGGTLTFVVDPNTGAYEAGIGVLNGATWEPFEGGIDNGFINEVRAIAFDGTDVLVGGCFASAGDTDVPAAFIARWSPTAGWSQIGDGLVNDVGVFLPSIEGANDIVVAGDGTLWIGGLFTRVGQDTPAVNLAHFSATEVATALVGAQPPLGIGGFVDDLAVDDDGHVIAGGGFAYAGPTVSGGLASFDGAGWTDLGNGLEGIVRDVLVMDDGSIAVAGELFYSDAAVAFAQSTASGWSLPGGPLGGAGFALLVDDDGVLWLGGAYLDDDGTPLGSLARLDGNTWTGPGTLVIDDRVAALALSDGNVVAAGSFSGGVAIQDGSNFALLGGGLDGDFAYANAVAVSPTLGVIVGGSFDGAGGVAAKGLVRFDGSAWHDVGGGIGGLNDFAFVSAITPYGDGAFVAGGFDTAGGDDAKNIAWFDGDAWHPLDAGLADLAESMVVADRVLYVGGPFTEAGGAAASGFAVWDFAD